MDGEIVWGESSINEAMITGESEPVHRRQGDRVIGGTYNQVSVWVWMCVKMCACPCGWVGADVCVCVCASCVCVCACVCVCVEE